ncbi:MAG: hypothetical protein Kow006_20070 [Gammaproteobacteria bacterium]
MRWFHLRLSAVATAVLFFTAVSVTALVSASTDLGTIYVESTTIDDRFENKRDEPSNIGVVKGETVDKAHIQNIQQVLQSVPGVTTEWQSGDSLKIHIRGIENQVYMGERPGVAVVIDGVPVFERTGRVNIDLDNIESIKVIKGGASYLFGDDALSGAVIITTKRGASYDNIHLAGEVGSFDYRKALARAGFAGEWGSGHLQISRRETDGYYDDSASQADYLNGKLQYYLDDVSDITFGVELADRWKNSHGSVRGVTAAANDPRSENVIDYNDYANHYEVNLDKLFVTYSRDIGDDANLMLNTYRFTDETDYLSKPLDANPSAYTYNNDYDQVQRGVKAEYRKGGERLAWLAAADLRDNSYAIHNTYLDCTDLAWDPSCVVGAPADNNHTDELVHAIYGEVKVRTAEKWVTTLNGRYDRIELDYSDALDSTNNGSKNFSVSSWRLGANYAAGESLDIYGNLSTGFRTPTARQLFVGNSSPSMRTDPNPDLEVETTLNLELGMRTRTEWFANPVDVDLAIFQIDREDYIQSNAGQYTTTSGARYENIGDVTSRGIELAVRSDASRRWSWDVAYTYLDSYYTRYDNFVLSTSPVGGACPPGTTPVTNPWPPFAVVGCETRYNNTGNPVPRVPHHHINLALRFRPATHWLITTEIDATSSYYADEINQEKIDGRTVVNLLFNYDRKTGDRAWSAFLRIENLFEEEYYNTARGHGDTNEDGVYDAEDLSIVVNQGRTWSAGLAVTF